MKNASGRAVLACSALALVTWAAPGCRGGEGGGGESLPDLHTVATTGDYEDLENRPALFDGRYESLTGRPALAEVATTGDYEDLSNRPVLFDGDWSSLSNRPPVGTVSQTPASLVNDGPQGAYVILDWDGTSDVVIASMASGAVPLGRPFLVEVPRTIPDSGGPGGHGPEALGRYVEFQHGEGIVCAANANLSYRARCLATAPPTAPACG